MTLLRHYRRRRRAAAVGSSVSPHDEPPEPRPRPCRHGNPKISTDIRQTIAAGSEGQLKVRQILKVLEARSALVLFQDGAQGCHLLQPPRCPRLLQLPQGAL